jgi:hypothetical protein
MLFRTTIGKCSWVVMLKVTLSLSILVVEEPLMKTGGVSTLLGGREMNIRISGSISQRGGSMLIEGDVQIGGGLDVHGGVSIRSFEDRIVVIGGNSTINGVMSTEGDITIAYVFNFSPLPV